MNETKSAAGSTATGGTSSEAAAAASSPSPSIASTLTSAPVVNLTQIISNVAVVIAAIVAYITYNDAVKTRSVDRSLEFVARIQESPLDSPFRLIREAVNANASFFDDIARLPEDQRSDPSIRKAASDLIVRRGKDGESLQSEIDTAIDYFKTLEICIETGSCDGDVAHSFFSTLAPELWTIIEPYIHDRRVKQPLFGKCLEHFVKRQWTGAKCYE